jgi:SAM-dependent methyltransferase
MKKEYTSAIPTCTICDGTEFKTIADLGVSKLIKCRSCGLVINNIITPICEDDYYKDIYDPLYENYYKSFRKKQYRQVMERLRHVASPNTKVLDVGCSYGWFLDIASEFGCSSTGAEPSKKVFETLSSHSCGDVYNLGIEDLAQVPGKFGMVTLWNVFEHLPSSQSALDLLGAKLMPGGILLLCVPNLNGLITKASFLVHRVTFGLAKNHLFRLYQLDNGYPHLYHFNRFNLEKLLRKNGFEPFAYWEQDIVDISNINARTESYLHGKWLSACLMNLALLILQWTARLIGNDELVILARKKSIT